MRPPLVAVTVFLLAVSLAAASASSQTSSTFEATFSSASGNEWWIQAKVDANEPLASVETRIDGGPWKPLVLRSWGAWAESHHAPPGSVVQFRATSTGNATALSGCYQWTEATLTSCPDASTSSLGNGNVTFTHGGGNEWWVEAKVSPRPTAVEAMDTVGSWKPLTFRDWGEWAGSFHIEPGHDVRFRALMDGAWNESCWYSHPTGVERCEAMSDDPAGPPLAEGSRRVAVMGDTGTGERAEANVQGSLNENATGFVGTGDYYYSSPPENWTRVFQPLLDQGSYVARGNHDDPALMPAQFPNGTTWSASLAGARVVGIDSTWPMGNGTEQHRFARDALCNATEALRVLVTHHNWWLEQRAYHPGTEFPAPAADMDGLVQDCGVDLVLAGHEHNYQRMMRGEVAYVIVGTGGQSLYPVEGAPPGTVASVSAYGRLLLDLNATGYQAHFMTLAGSTFESFHGSVWAAYAPPPAPAEPAPTKAAPTDANVTFTHAGGNEWWIEAVVDPMPHGVEARDTGGSWKTLTYRDWDEWAGSFHVEPGHDVQFAAVSTNGTRAESCWFTHPEGVELCGAAPLLYDAAFDATFRDASGNEWWLQVHVDANQDLAGVDARVNGASWKPLEFKSWGAWAESYHAPSGSTVEFRATATDGATDVSSTFAWPPG